MIRLQTEEEAVNSQAVLQDWLPATLYHVRAYATNSAGTAYGEDLPFTTLAVGMPVLSTTHCKFSYYDNCNFRRYYHI